MKSDANHEEYRVWVYSPDSPTDRVRGKFIEEDGNLSVLFDDIPKQRPRFLSEERPETLFCEGDKTISLYDTLSGIGPLGGIADRMTIQPNVALLGKHTRWPDARFDHLWVRLSGIDEWFRLSGFVMEPPSDNSTPEVAVGWSPVPKIELCVKTGEQITISTDLAINVIRVPRPECHLRQRIQIAMRLQSPAHLTDLLREFRKVTAFVEFARDESISIDEVLVGTGEGERLEVLAHWKERGGRSQSSLMHLFEFSEVKESFEEHLSRWFQLYDRMPLTLDMYRMAKRIPNLAVEYRFVTIVAALENLHRDLYDSSEDRKCAECKRRISVPLEQRLKEIANKHVHLTRELINVEDCERIAATRNYLAHQTSGLKERSLPDEEWFFHYRRLAMVFEICVLGELAFTANDLAAICERRWNLISSGMLGEWGL